MRISLPVLTLVLLASAPVRADAPAAKPDPWAAWKWLMGEWRTDNPPDQGQGAFTFAPDLDGKILVRRHAITIPATADRPAATHSDLLVVHPDPAGQRATYWDNEGHVIAYAAAADPAKPRVVLTSEPGPGPRFRLTYEGHGDTVDVVFEIAMPGKDFQTYLKGRAKRP